MNESSTLVYLVNKIKSEILKSIFTEYPESDLELDAQKEFYNFSPSQRTVQTVLNYAMSLEVADTDSVGKVEWMLN